MRGVIMKIKLFKNSILFFTGVFFLGICFNLYAALPEEIDPQSTVADQSQEVSNEQSESKVMTTEFKSTGSPSSNVELQQTTVSEVKSIMSGYESAELDLIDIVVNLDAMGFSSSDIALAALANGYSATDLYEAIAVVFSEEEAANVVPVSLIDGQKEVTVEVKALTDGGLSFEDMTNALLAFGYTYEEIAVALQGAGVSSQEVMQILQDAGYEDKEIVTILLDSNNTTEEIVQGMVDAGMSSDEILDSFKDSIGAITKSAELVAALINAGFSVADVISIAEAAGFSTQDKVSGLSDAGQSIQEIFALISGTDNEMVGYLIKAGFTSYEIAGEMIEMGKSINEVFSRIVRCAIQKNIKDNSQLLAEAKKVIPGGVNSPVRAFSAVGIEPRFIARAAGARLWDVQGKEYLDYVGSWGPLIHGHAYGPVVEAVRKAAGKGTSFGAPTEAEVELAQLVCERVKSVEMVRLVNSGTEATMTAVRLARAFTERSKIIKFVGGYHGHADTFLVKAGSGAATLGTPTSPGVPKEVVANTLTAEFNDLEAVRSLFKDHPGQIGAIIVEPICGNAGVIPPQRGFLQGLAELTSSEGAVLIFDEVMTGFRVHPGGAQTLYGIKPDIGQHRQSKIDKHHLHNDWRTANDLNIKKGDGVYESISIGAH